MPQLFEMIQNDYISNVVLITNKVSLYFLNGDITVGKNCNFAGTYYSWTVNYDNYQKWKQSKLM